MAPTLIEILKGSGSTNTPTTNTNDTTTTNDTTKTLTNWTIYDIINMSLNIIIIILLLCLFLKNKMRRVAENAREETRVANEAREARENQFHYNQARNQQK
jgi:flagellar biosynthesis/type III secretory pathway M-ring protein FliF/YscJ